jgi:transposase
MERLRPFFPKSRGKPRVDDRRVLSGIIFINRNGLRWRDAPAPYGPPKTLYNRWVRWSRLGVFARMLVELAAERAQTVSSDTQSYEIRRHLLLRGGGRPAWARGPQESARADAGRGAEVRRGRA